MEGDEDNKKISILSECFYSKDFTVDVELTRYPRNSPPLFFIRFTLRGTANYEINLTPWMFKQHKGEPTFCLELDPMLMIYRGRLILNSDKTSLAETVKDSERRRSRRLQMEPLKALRQSRFFHFFPGLTDYAEGITTLTLNRDGTLVIIQYLSNRMERDIQSLKKKKKKTKAQIQLKMSYYQDVALLQALEESLGGQRKRRIV